MLDLEPLELQEKLSTLSWKDQATEGGLRESMERQTSKETRSPSLLSRITSLTDLQGLPLQQTRGSIKTFSSSAIHSSRGKGEKSKVSVYVDIQSKIFQALGKDRERSDAAFESFIATIESHDSELEMAARRAATARVRERSASPPVSDADGQHSDDEPVSKKPKPDKSAYAWVAGRKGENLSKTLKLLDIYTVDPKAAKRLLIR